MPRPRKPASGRTRLLSPLCSREFVAVVRGLAEAGGHGSVGEYLMTLVAADADRRGVVLPERMPRHGGARPRARGKAKDAGDAAPA